MAYKNMKKQKAHVRELHRYNKMRKSMRSNSTSVQPFMSSNTEKIPLAAKIAGFFKLLFL